VLYVDVYLTKLYLFALFHIRYFMFATVSTAAETTTSPRTSKFTFDVLLQLLTAERLCIGLVPCEILGFHRNSLQDAPTWSPEGE